MAQGMMELIGNGCASAHAGPVSSDFSPSSWAPGSVKRTRMDLDKSELLAHERTAPNGTGRVWLESVSAGMRTVEAVIRELSQNDVPVLVVAERGSGKAAAAARIHALSDRAPQAFEVYLCSDVSDEMLARLDGQGGTVYLQEVGDLTSAAQKGLVRQIGL